MQSDVAGMKNEGNWKLLSLKDEMKVEMIRTTIWKSNTEKKKVRKDRMNKFT